MAEFEKPFAHHLLRQELRNHQGNVVGLGGRWVLTVVGSFLCEGAVGTVFALRRIDATGCDDPVENAEVFENLLAARLEAFAA